MSIRAVLASLLGLVLVALPSPARIEDDEPARPDEKALAAALAKSLKDADAIFTAEIGTVKSLGQTNSIPASVFGNVTFKVDMALTGKGPDGALSYSFREGSIINLDLDAKGIVLVARKGKGVLAIGPATDANLALAKQAIDAAREK